MATTVIYTTLGERKGTKRLWLEGRRLARAGISPGQHFELTSLDNVKGSHDGLTLRFTPTGDRRVSRRKRGDQELPVIDVSGETLVTAFGEAKRVRVVIRPGSIEIRVHHHDRATAERSKRLLQRLNQGEPLRMASLAHGGGILDHALHRGLAAAGVPVELAFANESDGDYLEASLANNPIWKSDSIAIEAPMQDVEWRKLPAIDILAAGLPCTGASLSGRAKNRLAKAEEHETAGPLFVAFLAAIQTLRPSVILLENVPQYGTTTSMTVIRSILSSLDYELHETVLDGFELGSMERRNRFCMIATNPEVPFAFDGLRAVRDRESCIRDILEDIDPDDPAWKAYSYLAEKEVRDKAAGKGFRRQLLDGSEESLGTIGRGYAKARSTEPFIRHPSDPALTRLLTPKEHARVKAVPEPLIEGLSATRAHEILGQSVVYAAFEAVGMHLGRALAALRDSMQPHQSVAA
ncbi:DNA cytosine methyltransferase [Thioalkalivibrio sp. ALE28]|uniref:DNA cytosine methyltransferase n=1 Tax=Thioalkalivibrio sp. ALE28 TaxID=1158179 RepID=UPI00039D1F40|nr:DNA cytosine methyltransferase [Thioalkalivibrio sp. ALE28]